MRIEKSLSKHLSKSLSKSLAGGDTPTPPTVISAIKLTFRPDLRTNVFQHLSAGAGGAGDELQMSYDGGHTWSDCYPGRGVSGGTWTELYIRGKCGSNPIAGLCGNFVKVEGNVMTLVDWENPAAAELAANQFYSTSGNRGLFQSYGSYQANFTDASELVLSATILADSCYRSMFEGCTALTSVPELPATTLATGCYERMFFGCSSLTSAMATLPATTLAAECYIHMFNQCGSLTTAPTLPATTLANYCYYQMFASCSSLNEIHCSATDITATGCTQYWTLGVADDGDFYGKTAANWTTGADGIPSGWTVHYPFTDFQEVQYLQSNGNNQMNTGVVGNQNTKVEIKFNGTAGAPFGSRPSDSISHDCLYTYIASSYEDIGWNSATTVYSPVFYGNDVTLTLSNGDCTAVVNGTSHTISVPTVASFTTPSNLWIWHNVTHLYTGKIYSFKIWQSDELVRNFIPCKRKSDSKAGFYDAVEHVFYTSTGGSDPTPGPEIRPFTDFQEVQYLESSGTQFIDTNYIPKTLHTKYDVDFTLIANNDSWQPIINNEGDVRFGIMSLYASSEGNGCGWIGSTDSYRDFLYYCVAGSRYSVQLDKNAAVVNGATVASFSDVVDASGSWSACILNRHLSPTTYNTAPLPSVKIWSVKIYEDGTLVRNFIPCYRKSDSVPGMYDSVNHVFYTNAGTGSFICGPDVNA